MGGNARKRLVPGLIRACLALAGTTRSRGDLPKIPDLKSEILREAECAFKVAYITGSVDRIPAAQPEDAYWGTESRWGRSCPYSHRPGSASCGSLRAAAGETAASVRESRHSGSGRDCV